MLIFADENIYVIVSKHHITSHHISAITKYLSMSEYSCRCVSVSAIVTVVDFDYISLVTTADYLFYSRS